MGSGAGQIQLTGGRSGFTNLQGDATSNFVTFGTAGTTVTWGDAAFNPTTFVMNDAGASSTMRIPNPFDLNGAARTIEVSATGAGAGRGTYGILTGDLGGTGASLVKTGAGTLMLDGSNSYNGGTTINGGGVWFRDTAAMPASGTVTVNDGGILSVSVGTGLWTTGTSGNGTMGGLLGGVGGSGQTITYSGNVGVGFNISGTQTYSGDIANVTGSTTTAIHIGNKDGSASSDPFTFAGTLTLSGNNSYTGATFVNVGTLIVGSANALGNGGDVTFKGGTLQYSAASAANDYGSRIKNSTSAILLNTNGQNVTLSNLGSGNTGGLTKSGAGTLTFAGTSAYSGATTLSAGTIAVYNGTLSSSSGAVSLASNTTVSVLGGSGVSSTWDLGNQDLQQSGSNVSNVQVTIDGDGVAGSALITNVRNLTWGRTITNSTMTITDGGQMNVTGEVRIGNPYYSLLGGANITIGGGTATSTFSGDGGDDFYIGYGERRQSNNNVVTVNSGGVLTNIRDMFVGHVNNAQNAGTTASTANQLTVTGTGTAGMRGLSVGYAQSGGTVSLIADANANVVEVVSGGQLSTSGTSYIGRANNTYTASNANTLTVSGTGSTWNAGNQTIHVGYTTATTAASNNNILTVANGGVLTNVNSLIVGSGSGTETGNQVVLDGGSISATSVTVNTGNTLSGGGTITGNTTIAGTLEIGVDGGSFDVIAITGDVDISAASLSIVPTGSGATLSSYTFLTYTGTLTPSSGPFFAEGALPLGYSIDYSTPGQIKLVSGGAPTGFAAWQAANSTTQAIDQDHDTDGVDNGVEYFIYGPNAASGFTPLPPVVNTSGVHSVTWTKAADYTGTYPANYVVETSDTLTGWTAAATNGSPNVANTVYINGNNVTYTFPAGTKKFARLKVTGP